MTVAEIAAKWGVSIPHVYQWIASGRLKCHQTAAGTEISANCAKPAKLHPGCKLGVKKRVKQG